MDTYKDELQGTVGDACSIVLAERIVAIHFFFGQHAIMHGRLEAQTNCRRRLLRLLRGKQRSYI